MRWRIPGCGVVVCAAALAAASMVAWGAMVVPWQAAGSYDGETITVEGDVVRARLEADTCVLEFSPDDPNAFRAILLIPLITDLPRQPQRHVAEQQTDPEQQHQPGRAEFHAAHDERAAAFAAGAHAPRQIFRR